jgi:formylglycine-generating enzyme required for sulfatase activity
MRQWLGIVVGAATVVLATAAGAAESRVALVIGNGAYVNAGALRNPPNDAREMAATLRRFGFEVIEREDANRRSMIEAIRAFAGKLSPGGVGLFFYAGHGIQARGANYLLPTDATLAAEDDLRFETFDVQQDVLDRMDEARVRLSLVILDACRDNPFARSFRSTTRGLAVVEAPRGTVIAYATAPGKLAADGEGRNGLYTAELLKAMGEQGVGLDDVFKHVADAVERKTNGAQTPWVASSFRGEFYFVAPTAASVAPAPAAPTPEGQEEVAWAAVATLTTPAPFEAFLARFPNGVYADIARAKLAELKERQQALAAPPPPPSPPRQPGPPVVENLDSTFIAVRSTKVRAEPRVTAPEIGALKAEATVAVTGRIGKEWLRVEWKGGVGYVAARQLEKVDAAEVAAWEQVKTATRAADVERFLAAYPKGFYAARAIALRDRLGKPAPAPSPREPAAITAPPPPPAAVLSAGKTFRDCPDCPEMVVVPPGEFMMGTAPSDAKGYSYERPQHPVRVRAAFAVGKYDVTKSEYARFVQATGRGSEICTIGYTQTDRDPVVCVNWSDAKAYAAWLSQTTGKSYRLLSEAEWEYAARAGTTTAYWWGDDVGSNRANCQGCGSEWDNRRVSPVGSFPANAFGLYDMLGNAWQWVEDCWTENYSGAPGDAAVAVASGECGRRVIRGGSWGSLPGLIRAGYRFWVDSGFRYHNLSFRVARAL